MNYSLNDLWNRIRLGDENAFDILFKENYAALCNFAFRIIGDLKDAEEIVEDAYLYLWQNHDTIIVKESVKSYLYQVVHNLAVNRLEHYRTKKYSTNKLASATEWKFIHNTYTVNDTLIQRLEAKETEVLIKQTIENLPEKCREIFQMSRFQNMSNEEISEKLNISQNTIRVQIFNALKIIKEVLKKMNIIFLLFQ